MVLYNRVILYIFSHTYTYTYICSVEQYTGCVVSYTAISLTDTIWSFWIRSSTIVSPQYCNNKSTVLSMKYEIPLNTTYGHTNVHTHTHAHAHAHPHAHTRTHTHTHTRTHTHAHTHTHTHTHMHTHIHTHNNDNMCISLKAVQWLTVQSHNELTCKEYTAVLLLQKHPCMLWMILYYQSVLEVPLNSNNKMLPWLLHMVKHTILLCTMNGTEVLTLSSYYSKRVVCKPNSSNNGTIKSVTGMTQWLLSSWPV